MLNKTKEVEYIETVEATTTIITTPKKSKYGLILLDKPTYLKTFISPKSHPILYATRFLRLKKKNEKNKQTNINFFSGQPYLTFIYFVHQYRNGIKCKNEMK